MKRVAGWRMRVSHPNGSRAATATEARQRRASRLIVDLLLIGATGTVATYATAHAEHMLMRVAGTVASIVTAGLIVSAIVTRRRA